MNTLIGISALRCLFLKQYPTVVWQMIHSDPFVLYCLFCCFRFQCLRSLNLADNNLDAFPKSICEMTGLAELNLGCNKIESIPTTIGDLVNLQALHLHNNHLSGMPDEILQLKKLVILVLAFNKFHQIPASVAQLTDVRTSECETIIMAGNLIETISTEVIQKLKHAKKVILVLPIIYGNYAHRVTGIKGLKSLPKYVSWFLVIYSSLY